MILRSGYKKEAFLRMVSQCIPGHMVGEPQNETVQFWCGEDWTKTEYYFGGGWWRGWLWSKEGTDEVIGLTLYNPSYQHKEEDLLKPRDAEKGIAALAGLDYIDEYEKQREWEEKNGEWKTL